MEKTEAFIYFYEDQVISFIKDILCCPKEWEYNSIQQKIFIGVCADTFKVQKAIFDWLNLPERREGFTHAVENNISHEEAYGGKQ